MCGITGIVAPGVRRYESELSAMTTTLGHRGPDAEGTYMFQNCGLGHRRLSIVDLVSGQQPMLDPTSTLAVIFNGEIYGYNDIRATCLDYPFQTTSDTEVILALYTREGKNCASKLPGMFAFALWDDQEQLLYCARDRFGEKPFYYAFGKNGEFLFASEIKAILASGLIEPIIDKNALTFYLQRFYVHPHQTIYKNIFTLPPAHMLCYTNGNLTVDRYWALPELNDNIDLHEAKEEFDRLLNNAVAKQLVADVPVGAFLSGGLDSSTIVAYASNHQARIKTFSFGFENGVNELPFARDVANQYNTEHIELSDSKTDIGELLFTMQQVYDEPFGDTSNIPTYLISKLAREHIKVVLTGDGGDELLGGYSWWYPPLQRMAQLNAQKMLFYRMLFRATRISHRLNRRVSSSLRDVLHAMDLRRRYPSVAAAHYYQRQHFSREDLEKLGLHVPALDHSFFEQYNSGTVDDAMRMDIETWMAGDILVKIDRASMAHGLELRAPFLDVDFASFCISLPSRLKITSDTDKHIMREACSTLWPESIRNRSKVGFGVPFDDWFNRNAVRMLVDDYLGQPQRKIFQLIDFDQSRTITNQSTIQTWILLVLSLWMENHKFSIAD